ncbi:MAG TPA: GNAT family N-acetyltransferase [Pyrinomonadaceae bacterium]
MVIWDITELTQRETVPEDEAFLFQVYLSSRGDDLTEMGWDAERVRNFLETQYAAQQRFLKANYPQGEDRIITLDTQPIGRIVVERNDQEIRVVDIALLPQYRNSGIGTYLIRELLTEAARLGKPFRTQVIRSSAALGLFERLGIVKIGETGSHYQMEWRADA